VGTRSYGQHCGLAAAMDLIGQRWSMLIVRELSPGPRRFTDLHDGLPGLATDVLASRLRELVAAGVVEHRSVRHPVPAKTYALTDTGEELAEIARRLADWGRPLLPRTPDGDSVVRARWALQTMAMAYRGGAPDGHYEFCIDGDELCVTVAGSTATVRYGTAPEPPAVRMTSTTAAFFRAVGEPSWVSTTHRGVAIEGDAGVLASLLTALPLEVGADATKRRRAISTN
jgi:DNA-binding HxlR family transcriptional regulator